MRNHGADQTLAALADLSPPSRRQLLAALAGAGLGAAASPALADKKTRKAVKRARKQSRRLCQSQEGQCAQAMATLCTNLNPDAGDAAACTTQFTACCAFLADCQMTSFFSCAVTPR